MVIKNIHLMIIVLVLIFGGIFITDLAGVWQTESEKEVSKTIEGLNDPGDIKGSFTFEDIMNNFDVPLEAFKIAFVVPDADETFAIKDFETIFEGVLLEDQELGTSSVKLFVSLYTGIESDSVEDTNLTAAALELLLDEGKIDQATYDRLKPLEINVTPDMVLPLAESETSEATSSEEDVVEEDFEIKGNTTFYEIISLGVTKEEILEVMGYELESDALKIKDVVEELGLDFETVKLELLEMMD
jgi:hypothetical protein